MRIPCHCQGFDPKRWSHLQGNQMLDVEWHDLVWAAVSVGKLGYDDLMAHGHFSIDEMRFRYYLIYSHLMQTKNRVRKSTLYESLDSTEKGAASYFVGMAASKLVGAFLLNIPWLVHLEKIRILFQVGLRGKSRPDLLGIDSQGKWVVFEAKGRTGGFSSEALDTAKTQTRQVSHIGGQVPSLKVATESYFNPFLNIRIVDPEEFDENTIDLRIDRKQFYSSYYSLFRNLFQQASRQEEINYQLYKFIDNEPAGVSIGINQDILGRLENEDAEPENMWDFSPNIGKLTRRDNRTIKYYPDGIVISLDEKLWASQIMSLDPSKRR